MRYDARSYSLFPRYLFIYPYSYGAESNKFLRDEASKCASRRLFFRLKIDAPGERVDGRVFFPVRSSSESWLGSPGREGNFRVISNQFSLETNCKRAFMGQCTFREPPTYHGRKISRVHFPYLRSYFNAGNQERGKFFSSALRKVFDWFAVRVTNN